MMRRAVALLLAFSVLGPAAQAGDDKQTFGYNVGFAGQIVSWATPFPPVRGSDDAPSQYQIAGQCAYTTSGLESEVFVTYEGSVTSAGPQAPLFTSVQCSVDTFAAGGTESHQSQVGAPGSTSAMVATAGPWPVRGVTVCVAGYAIVGPPLMHVVLPRSCLTPMV